MVMICSIIVSFTESNIAKYVDPGISIVSAALLLYLKYPNSKQIYYYSIRKNTLINIVLKI